jgi:hypothetical protein
MQLPIAAAGPRQAPGGCCFERAKPDIGQARTYEIDGALVAEHLADLLIVDEPEHAGIVDGATVVGRDTIDRIKIANP